MDFKPEPGQAQRPRQLPIDASAPSRPATEALPVAERLQIIGMELSSLLSTRSLTWTESFSRANMFLYSLSGAIVALALAATGTSFGREFLWFALVILSVVLFLGLASFDRLVAANNEDLLWVQGLNRLRHAYLELAPDLERYFVAAAHDDEAGVLRTMGTVPDVRAIYHHVFLTTPLVVGVIDAVLAASVAGAIAFLAELPAAWSGGVALATFLAVVIGIVTYQLRAFPRHVGSAQFPAHGSARGSVDPRVAWADAISTEQETSK